MVREDRRQVRGDLFAAFHRGPVESDQVRVLGEEIGEALGRSLVPRAEHRAIQRLDLVLFVPCVHAGRPPGRILAHFARLLVGPEGT